MRRAWSAGHIASRRCGWPLASKTGDPSEPETKDIPPSQVAKGEPLANGHRPLMR